jgi:hypothetical protein
MLNCKAQSPSRCKASGGPELYSDTSPKKENFITLILFRRAKMAEYNINSQFTLLERDKRSVDGKRILPTIDVMGKMGVRDFLRDVPYFPSSNGLKHRYSRTNSRPSSTRRRFYQGVERTSDTTQEVWIDTILLESRSEIDEDHVDTLENGKELRRQKDRAHLEGMLEDACYNFFNDAPTSGAQYMDGFLNRSSTLSYPGGSTTTLPFCWNGGGSSTLGSIYVIDWGPLACHAVFPTYGMPGSSALGIDVRNKGKEQKADTDSSTATYYVYVTQFKKWVGLAMADDRRWFRVANVNCTYGGSSTFDETLLIRALNHSWINPSSARMYVNPYIKAQIDIRAEMKGNVNLTMKNVFGEPVMTFLGIPIRKLDETILTASETAVT